MELRVGKKVTGTVTGIQPYGVFVDIGDHTQGLIHISECRLGYVEDIYKLFHVDQIVSALIIDIDEYSGKISLSLRSQQVDYAILNHPKSFRPRRIHYWTNYRLSIGFKPLAQARGTWMSEAKNLF
ncbi:CvfD/Ygs/GSP13 family RNA-binding post-transcriptional regulator [Lentilactobacillus sunkii]|uniref:CvfD/Ygs/GSP13 family RNA-binding post-transcriptional regulator n=1 Tax=Lentilactobacillus sunkii TaxID=481719 RepID=UPI00070BE084|nr:CvfD/Ygs/GSP13 family RNA-binding post-transcriptional regulator [Lentilactobacillus sunkii]